MSTKENITVTEELNQEEKKLLEYIYRVQKEQKNLAVFTSEEYTSFYYGEARPDQYEHIYTMVKKLKLTSIEYKDGEGQLVHVPLLSFFMISIKNKTYSVKINDYAMAYIGEVVGKDL